MKLPLYLISDVHLSMNGSADEAEKRCHLAQFIGHVGETGGTLFIVGDLFDFWFEYKHVIPKAYFGLLSWDRGYRILRSILRNRIFVFLYRWLHPDLGYAIAKHFSRNGDYDHHTPEYKEEIVADLTEYCEEQCKNGIDYVIMGHYHQHKEIQLENGRFLILGDWIKYHSYGYFDGEQLSLKSWGTGQTDD